MIDSPVDSSPSRSEGESPQAFPRFAGTARFQPLALIGRGNMGIVYRVHDRETGTEVALKTFSAPSADQLYRLKQEFRVLADIVHPGLVELYELFATEETSFFTMEYVEGVDFVEHVRRDGGVVDVPRLVDAASQLAEGLAAVHAAGKLHRDVKRSNVLVTRVGRAVLLDFGLATALGLEGPSHYAPSAAGTLAYMAPEVVWGQPPTPAADWYGFGVMLYEALTGRLPFSGPGLLERRQARPPSVRSHDPELPESLAALVAELLDPDPAQRPEARQILQRLTGGPARKSHELAANRAAFVGRSAELARLRQALTNVGGGATAVVHVVGPSGIGKSELLRHFLSSAEADVLVLGGRCHPQEEVPYKAFDTLIDTLSRVLLSRLDTDAADLVPESGAALARLFPVLGRVPAFEKLEPISAEAEPHEIRRRGFGSLRELLARLSRRQRLVLWIDDLQWGDADSAALLRELLRPPDSPAMLVLLSYRSEHDTGLPFKELVDEKIAVARETIELGPLELSETTELARRLCALQTEADRRVAEIVAEARGNPFFLGELSRSLASGNPPVSLRLGTAISDRVQQLPDRARELLEVISVAGSPLRRSVLLQAAGLGEQGRPLISNLEKRSLLRTTALDRQPTVEIYHDRIREALLGMLPADVLRARHGDLADVLERQPEPDAEALFRHCLGAGRREQAGNWAMQAAERASDTLAFDRAAELYREALELRDDEGERPELVTKLGEALANAGRSLDAADTFEQAAREHVALSGRPEQVLELRRRAAEHYLRSGRVDAGTAAMRAVLAAVGVTYPSTPGKALAAALLMRLKLAWRGLGFRARPREEASPEMRRRLDACWGAFSVLAMIDQTAAEVLAVRHLRDALDAGDVVHISHALGLEVTKSRQIGGRFLHRRADRLRQVMERLTEEHGGPYERAHFQVVSGTEAFEAGRWREARDHCDIGTKILREQCRAVAWEIVTSEGFALSALAQMGQLAEMARRLPLLAGNAQERGDLYAQLCFNAGFPNLVWLAQDQPGRARQLADDSMRGWPSTAAFDIEQYLHLIAALHVDLYVGDAGGAWRRINEAWPKVQRALLLVMESPRVELRNMRARAALALANGGLAESSKGDSRAIRRLLRLAARDAKRIAADANIASALPFSLLLRAGVTHARGGADAAALYAEAARACDTAAMALYAAAARYREGELRAGETGARLRLDAEAWMRRQGIRNPPAMVRVWCPVGSAPPAARVS